MRRLYNFCCLVLMLIFCLTGCSGESSGKIDVPFSHEEIYYKPYTDIEKELQDLGFTNIEFNTMGYNRDSENAFDGAVVGVYFDGEWEFDEGSSFAPDVPIVITYLVDNFLYAPKSNIECEGQPYEEIVELFSEAGFTNVITSAIEVTQTDNENEGSVVAISINYSGSNYTEEFDETSEFNADDQVVVYYSVFTDVIAESDDTVQNETEQSDDYGSSNNTTGGESPNPTTNNQDDGNSVTVPNAEETVGNLVWVPTNGGTKYHSKAGCSNMEDPMQVSLETAKANGYEACKRCH